MKIVINSCFGGFGLSNKGIKRYLELQGKECWFYKQTKYEYNDGKDEYILSDENDDSLFVIFNTKYLGEVTNELDDDFYYGDISRTDENLIKVVEELGSEANSRFSDLKIVEIPDDVEWDIDDYDGIETIHEEEKNLSMACC